MHPERSGSTVFARYAFNELVSFVAGWAILLDYIILIAVTAYSATQYLRVFWSPLGHQAEALGLRARLHRAGGVEQHPRLRLAPRSADRHSRDRDLALQALIVVLGLVPSSTRARC